MSLDVEKEIQWLTTCVLPKTLRNGRLLDRDYSESLADTFQVGHIDISVIGTEEAYMLTVCYRAVVNFSYAGQQHQRRLIVKKTPNLSPDIYEGVQFGDLFSNEIGFYTEILPVLQEQSNGKFSAPRYYYSEIQPNSALIILGDFGADGWTVTKDRYGLSLEHARIAVKYLGKFHGFGYVMKHNHKERFEMLTEKFREARFAKKSLNKEWELKHRTGLKRAERAVSKYQPDVDMDFIRQFQRLVYSYIGYGRQRVAPREPLSTFCHGDYLRNNLAYKYDTDRHGNPIKIMMFDYQTMRHCSPMIDLALFMALSLLADVRHTHFDSLFDDYCNSLFESYRRYSGLPLPDFLNREELLKEYIRFLPYAVHITCYFLMSLVDAPTIPPSEMFNQKRTEQDIVQAALTEGGEIVDREIAHQLKEMFDLSQAHNVQIDEGIDASAWLDDANKFLTERNALFDDA